MDQKYTSFEDFLEKNNTSLSTYFSNVAHYLNINAKYINTENIHTLSDLIEFLNLAPGDTGLWYIISSPFSWEETPEGHMFWDDIHKEWLKFSKDSEDDLKIFNVNKTSKGFGHLRINYGIEDIKKIDEI